MNQTITINNILYRVGVNHYAEYYSKGTWRTSASITNDVILDKLDKIGRLNWD